MIIQLQFSEIMGCANMFINSNELSVLVLFSRSQDFIPGITFKDVLRKEIKMFFFNSEGNRRQYLKKKIGNLKT
jgi:hypothetical protein